MIWGNRMWKYFQDSGAKWEEQLLQVCLLFAHFLWNRRKFKFGIEKKWFHNHFWFGCIEPIWRRRLVINVNTWKNPSYFQVTSGTKPFLPLKKVYAFHYIFIYWKSLKWSQSQWIDSKSLILLNMVSAQNVGVLNHQN